MGNVLQGVGPGGASFCIGVVGRVISDREESIGYSYRVPATYRAEPGAEKPRQDMGDTSGG